MKYKGYIIEQEFNHYKVSGPIGEWREDTITEAKKTIDEEMEDDNG